MQSLRVVRRTRSLTFLDLALLSGIPARQIAEIEYGLRRLSVSEREALALVLGLGPRDFTGAHRRLSGPQAQATAVALPDRRAAQALAIAALAAAVATGSTGAVVGNLPGIDLARIGITTQPPVRLPSSLQPAPIAAPENAPIAPVMVPVAISGALNNLGLDPVRDNATQIWHQMLTELVERASALREALAPVLLIAPTPDEAVAPAPLPVIESLPPFDLTEGGPMGCPVAPTAGRVVMTQGYGVGSHAPAEIWGAVDLAVDSNGDGYAEMAGSWYQPVVATHDGHAGVALDSYPGGNHVSIYDPSGVWRTGYSHLALVTVVSGQFVRAGEQIGLIGSTGMSTGPHLDYQIWRNGVNIDPTTLIGC